MKRLLIGFAVLLGALFVGASGTYAADCTFSSNGTSDFNTAANWTCASVPGNGDSVFIPTATSVTMSAGPISVTNLHVTGTLNIVSFDLTATSTSSIDDGTATSTSGNFGFGGRLDMHNGAALGSISGGINVSSTFAIRNSSNVNVGSGTTTSYGGLQLSNVASISINGGTFELQGSTDPVISSTAFIYGGTGKFLFRNTGGVSLTFPQTIGTYLYDFYVDKSDGSALTLNEYVTSTNDFLIFDGTVTLGTSTSTIGGDLTVAAGSTLNEGTSMVLFNGAASLQTASSTAYYHLKINKSDGTVYIPITSITVTHFTHQEGTFQHNASGATLNVSGDISLSGDAVASLGGSYTINMNGSGAQSYDFQNYSPANLTVNKSAGTLTFGNDNYAFTSDISVISGAVTLGSGTTTVSDDFVLAGGTLNTGSGTVRYSGTTQHEVASTTYNNLVFNNNQNGSFLSASTTVVGRLEITANSQIHIANATMTVVGDLSNLGVVHVSSTDGGALLKDLDSVTVTDSSGTEVTSLAPGDKVYLTVQDQNANLDGTTQETITVTMSGDSSSGGDTETITLTETTVSSGIFRNGTGVGIASGSATANNGDFEISAAGVGTGSYTDSNDSADTGSDTVTLAAASSGSGGSGGGGGGGGGLPPSGDVEGQGTAGLTSDTAEKASVATAEALSNLVDQGIAVHGLVKLPDDGNPDTQLDSAVYYIGGDGMRHAFPNSKVYFTWFCSFAGVQVVSVDVLATIPLGQNVTYIPGRRMVKFTSDNKVYAVTKGGILRWVTTEALAETFYGADWNTKIDDIDIAFYPNYLFGENINEASDFDPMSEELSVAYPSDTLRIGGYQESEPRTDTMVCTQ